MRAVRFLFNPKLKGLLLPGIAFLCIAMLLLETGLLVPSIAGVDFYFYGSIAAGVLLAWRFQNARILFTVLTIALSHRAVAFFSPNHFVQVGPGHSAFLAIAVLLPVNFALFASGRERGLSAGTVAPRTGLLLLEAVFVAVICRPGGTTPAFLKVSLGLPWHAKVPPLGVVALVVSILFLALKYLASNRPSHAAQMGALVASWIALEKGYLGRFPEAYLATAGLILVAGIVEDSYLLAYRDELTGIPGRRAFNEAIAQVEAPYVIAAVDIDHFKNFNDTYGHDTGDQVLRLVASRLARVTGKGQAFRVGGEEFAILFAGKRFNETFGHLEALRAEIERASFRKRTGEERRSAARGPDRRNSRKQADRKRQLTLFQEDQLSVTVSIGVAEASHAGQSPESVIVSADKALYRAKTAGRNRVEGSRRSSPQRRKAKQVTA